MKKRWISSSVVALFLTATTLQANETASRTENLKTLWQELLPDAALEMFAGQSTDVQEKKIDPSFLVPKLREELYKEPIWTQLTESYNSFSDEEIANLASILTSPLYKKFTTEGMQGMMAVYGIIQTALSNLAQTVEASAPLAIEKAASTTMIEVTSENFASVVEQSDIPLIIDVYAPWCPPCKKLSPILERASERYPQIRFVKINIETEAEIANRFNVRQLPTLLFFLPKESAPSIKSVGLLSEKALGEKIAEFQKLF